MDAALADAPTEDIPDTAMVARLIFFPLAYSDAEGILWKNSFIFLQDKVSKAYLGKSVCWDKYAALPDAVHRLGCIREAAKRGGYSGRT
jgi:hypothetical protein